MSHSNIILTMTVFASLFGCKQVKTIPSNANKSNKSIYDYTVNSIEGLPVNLKSYKGKKILIVNVASKCGYTPQYKDLEKLYEDYNDQLVVLGFPSNNFLSQEPGTNNEIASFCTKNYGVSFPMFEKLNVKGDSIAPVYDWLSNKNLNGWNDQKPSWNFCKYLINEEGELIGFYSSNINPLSEEIISHLKNNSKKVDKKI
jgi:glutathione peroxidase